MNDTLTLAVETLKAQVPNLLPQDQGFAMSLIASWGTYHRLSEKQLWWVNKLSERAMGFDKPAAPKVENVGVFSGVYAMFTEAKKHLKYPKIKLQVDTQEIELSMAGAASKCPNTVNVTDAQPYGYNKWFGRVDAAGTWTQNQKFSEAELKPVRRLLQTFAVDPAGVAKKYSLLTGRCCFCNLPLTDPRSTAVGYGETCSKHYGLHSSWKAAVSVFDKVGS